MSDDFEAMESRLLAEREREAGHELSDAETARILYEYAVRNRMALIFLRHQWLLHAVL